MRPKDILTKEFLIEQFVNQKKSTVRIANENNIKSRNSVNQFLKKFHISRPSLRDKSHITYNELYNLYIIQQNGLKETGKMLGLTNKLTVKKLLKQHNIPIRKNSFATPKMQHDWSKKRTGYKDIYGHYWGTLKYNANHRHIPFEISIEYVWELYIQQDKKCAISGIPLKFKVLGELKENQTASLDRIDSSKGYIEGNVQWVHKTINKMKMCMSTQELVDWCYIIVKNNKESLLL